METYFCATCDTQMRLHSVRLHDGEKERALTPCVCREVVPVFVRVVPISAPTGHEPALAVPHGFFGLRDKSVLLQS